MVDRLQQWKHIAKSLLHYYKVRFGSSKRFSRPACSGSSIADNLLLLSPFAMPV